MVSRYERIALSSVSMILIGALRGAGDTGWPLAITFVGFLGVRIPLAYFLAWKTVEFGSWGSIEGYDLGVIGAWYAMVADLVLRSFLIGGRFWHGGWRYVKV